MPSNIMLKINRNSYSKCIPFTIWLLFLDSVLNAIDRIQYKLVQPSPTIWMKSKRKKKRNRECKCVRDETVPMVDRSRMHKNEVKWRKTEKKEKLKQQTQRLMKTSERNTPRAGIPIENACYTVGECSRLLGAIMTPQLDNTMLSHNRAWMSSCCGWRCDFYCWPADWYAVSR